MTVWTISLLIGALLTAGINYNQPRALLWIVVGATNFAATYFYARHSISWLPHAFVCGVFDAAVVFCIVHWRETVWERLVEYCFALSILASVSLLVGWLPDKTAHAIAMEICMWLALLVIGTHGLLRLIDETASDRVVGQIARATFSRAVHRARMALERKDRSEGIMARAGTQR